MITVSQLLDIDDQITKGELAAASLGINQLIRELSNGDQLPVSDPVPVPPKPKRKATFQYNPPPGAKLLDLVEVRRLVNEKCETENTSLHKMSKTLGFNGSSSEIPGFRSADKHKDTANSIHAERLAKILGDSILVKEEPGLGE